MRVACAGYTVSYKDGVMLELYVNDLYVRQYGEKERKLLLVNGAMADCSFYNDLAEYLCDAYTVFTYDHPGYARSKGEGKSLWEQERDIAALVKRIGRCSIIGHSCGAIPVLSYLLKDGRDADQVLLYEPFLCDLSDDERIRALRKEMPVLLKEGRYEEAGMKLLSVLSAEPGAREFGEEQRKYFVRNSRAFYEQECLSMLENRMDYEKLKGKKIITGIGTCTKGMPCEEMAERFQEKTDCRIVQSAGAHDAPYEQYEAFGKTVKELSL